MPLPVAHALVGAGMVALSREGFSLRRDWAPIIVGAALGTIPDIDLIVSWALGYGLKDHGGFSHSIFFALALGSSVSLLMGEKRVVGTLGYLGAGLSHGVLDVLTKKEFGGAQLLWPVSVMKYRLGLISNYEFYPDLNSQPFWSILKQALVFSGYELLACLPIFLLILFLKSRGGSSRR